MITGIHVKKNISLTIWKEGKRHNKWKKEKREELKCTYVA
jgi:hypothetical protein